MKDLNEKLATEVMGWDSFYSLYYEARVWDLGNDRRMIQSLWNPTTDLNQLRECYLAAEKGDPDFGYNFYKELSRILEQRIRDQISPIASMSNVWVKHPELTAENERLTRVVEQAIDCGSLEVVTITDENKNNFLNGWRNVGNTIIAGIGATERFIAGYPESEPDLFAQLKGVDRG